MGKGPHFPQEVPRYSAKVPQESINTAMSSLYVYPMSQKAKKPHTVGFHFERSHNNFRAPP